MGSGALNLLLKLPPNGGLGPFAVVSAARVTDHPVLLGMERSPRVGDFPSTQASPTPLQVAQGLQTLQKDPGNPPRPAQSYFPADGPTGCAGSGPSVAPPLSRSITEYTDPKECGLKAEPA